MPQLLHLEKSALVLLTPEKDVRSSSFSSPFSFWPEAYILSDWKIFFLPIGRLNRIKPNC